MGIRYDWENAHTALHNRVDTDARVLDKVMSNYTAKLDDFYRVTIKRYGKKGVLGTEQMAKVLSPSESAKFKGMLQNWLSSGKYDSDKQFVRKIKRTLDMPTLRVKNGVEMRLRSITSLIKSEQSPHLLKSLYQTYLDSERTVARITGVAFTQAGDDVIFKAIAKKFQGSTVTSKLWNQADNIYLSFRANMNIALKSGLSYSGAKQLVKYYFSNGDYRAKRLLVTESSRINSVADLRAYKKVGAKYYQYIAVMDSLTSGICRSKDLKVFRVDKAEIGFNMPPLHPNCRSGTKPFFIDDRTGTNSPPPKPKRKVKKPPVVPPVIPPSKPIKDMTKKEVEAELARSNAESLKANKKYDADRQKLDDERLKLRKDWQKKRKTLSGKAYDTAYAEYLAKKKTIVELIDDLDASDQKRFEEVMRRQKPYTARIWALEKAERDKIAKLKRDTEKKKREAKRKAAEAKKKAERKKFEKKIKEWGKSYSRNAPDWLKSAIAKYEVQLEKIINRVDKTDWGTNAYYYGVDDLINMHKYDKRSAYGEAVYRHEFGHFLDDRIGSAGWGGTVTGYRNYASGKSWFTDAMNTDKLFTKKASGFGRGKKSTDAWRRIENEHSAIKFMAEEKMAKAKRVLLKEVGLTNKQFDDWFAKSVNISDSLENKTRKLQLLTAIKNKDALRIVKYGRELDSGYIGYSSLKYMRSGQQLESNGFMAGVSDSLGAATNNQMAGHSKLYGGFGHPTAYFKDAGAKQTEIWANMTAAYGSGDKVTILIWESIFPEMTKIYKEIIQDAI